MIETYCNYGLHDDDTGKCFEEGETVNIKMIDDRTYEEVDIKSISSDEIVIEDMDGEEFTLKIIDIWEMD